MRHFLALLALPLTFALGGCTSSVSSETSDPMSEPSESALSCTEIGAEAAITVQFSPEAMDRITELTLTACTSRSQCSSTHKTQADFTATDATRSDYFLITPWPYQDDHATIELNVVAPGHDATFTTEVELEPYSPNGPQCPPHVLQANLAFIEGSLMQVHG